MFMRDPREALRGLQGGYGGPSFLPDPRAVPTSGAATAPNVGQLRYQADVTDRAALQRVQRQGAQANQKFMLDPNNPRGLAGMGLAEMNEAGGQLQRQSNPEFDQWRLYGQALKNKGVDRLQTAGAASAKQGGGVDRRQLVDYQSQLRGGPQVTGYTSGPNLGDAPGFFDNAPNISIAEMYQRSPGMTMDPTGYQQHELRGGNNIYENNVLKQLRNWRS